MNYTEPKVIYTCFPGGKHKVLTMSYDDGRLEDRRLVELFNRYGIRGTFNLNGGLPRPERIPESEWVELYKGHEVACHTYHHPTISRSPLDQTARQVLADRMQLEGVMGYPVRGLAYPNGSWSPEIAALLPALGRIDMALVGEPTGMQAAAGERGLVVLDCTAHGRAGHAARDEGINALYIAADDIAWLRGYRFERCSPLLGPIRMTATQIEAGTQHNVVPAECRFVVDVRTTDAYTNEETVEIVRRHMRSEAVPRSTRIRASAVAPEHPLVGAAAALGVERFVSPTTSDMALMAFPSLKMGAGDSARSHTADEYVLRSEVEQGVEGYIRYIAELAKRY